MKKRIFYTELSYVLGILTLALGASMLVKADFGVSVVVAPTYILHLKVSETFSFFTFGVSEYFVQGVLLVLLTLFVRRFHWSYLCSFVTALFYGLVLDLVLRLFATFSLDGLLFRLIFFALGLVICAIGVSLFFHTYLSPEAYELMVKELSNKYRWRIGIVKTIYDCISCLVALILSFSFFGFLQFHGIGVGTAVSALLNGRLIAWVNGFLEERFTFQAAFPAWEGAFAPPPFSTGADGEPAVQG